LLLNTAIGLVVTGPLRAAWRRTETRLSPGAAVPMLVSVALLLYSIGFMTTYVHPFGRTWAAAEYGRAAADLLVAVPHTVTRQLSVAMLFQFLGVTSVLLQSAILSGPVLLLVRRWGVGLPFGSFGLVFGLLGLLMALPRDLHLATGPWPIVAVAIA